MSAIFQTGKRADVASLIEIEAILESTGLLLIISVFFTAKNPKIKIKSTASLYKEIFLRIPPFSSNIINKTKATIIPPIKPSIAPLVAV